MKKQLVKLALLGAMVFMASASTLAVPLISFRIQAKVPFDFHIGNKKFPKGEYIIESVSETGVMRISNNKGKKAINFTAVRDKENKKMKSRLSFRRYGDQYFLRKVWDGQDIIYELSRSSAEKKVAKALKGKEDAEGDEVDN
ncbi:MAG: hypothetical protein HY011_01835 [Acidobacteria bacterium]|nr:hypothetical protein [Acidobacteriota bacterium]